MKAIEGGIVVARGMLFISGVGSCDSQRCIVIPPKNGMTPTSIHIHSDTFSLFADFLVGPTRLRGEGAWAPGAPNDW